MVLKDIAIDEYIVKYGHTIGYVNQPINQGDWVHNHNIRSGRGRIKKDLYNIMKFYGYFRTDWRVGVRNHLLVAPSVFVLKK